LSCSLAKLVKIDFPPGLSRRGTLYETQGRWYDSNLVRWFEGLMTPIGGWTQRTVSAMTGKARAMIAWRANDNQRWIAVATHSNLYAMTAGAIIPDDITPVGFTTGRADADLSGGYGAGPYGYHTYGTPRPTDITGALQATVCSLDTYGQNLLACSPDDGRIWYWQLSGVAAALTNAPTDCLGVVATAERFVFALGASGFRRRVQWSDQDAETTWTPSSTNQAGDFDLQTGGQIMCGKKLRFGTLIWTDVDVHLASYQGLPFVYVFNRVGDNCGAISRGCAVAVDAAAYWMSPNGFFVFDGSMRQIPCDVFDAVFGDLNQAQRSKITGWMNGQNQEVWWFYPSSGSTEIDRAVVYNVREQHWALHQIVRLSAVDRGVIGNPIAAGNDGYIYNHETGASWGGSTPYAESGPAEAGEGDQVLRVRRIIFDEDTAGDAEVSVKTRDWPNGTETTAGPYASDNPVSVRIAGRQMRLRVEFQQAGQWGTARFELVEGSKR
jgi:hypothetical protein